MMLNAGKLKGIWHQFLAVHIIFPQFNVVSSCYMSAEIWCFIQSRGSGNDGSLSRTLVTVLSAQSVPWKTLITCLSFEEKVDQKSCQLRELVMWVDHKILNKTVETSDIDGHIWRKTRSTFLCIIYLDHSTVTSRHIQWCSEGLGNRWCPFLLCSICLMPHHIECNFEVKYWEPWKASCTGCWWFMSYSAIWCCFQLPYVSKIRCFIQAGGSGSDGSLSRKLVAVLSEPSALQGPLITGKSLET
jgi:hypothetical protein